MLVRYLIFSSCGSELRSYNGKNFQMFRTDIVATYNSTLAAEYALNKLQGLEYPLGDYICVESKGVNK